jgi:hypothetical protein
MASKERLMLVLNREKPDRLPVKIALIDESKLPMQIGMLTTLDLIQVLCDEHEFDLPPFSLRQDLIPKKWTYEGAGQLQVFSHYTWSDLRRQVT